MTNNEKFNALINGCNQPRLVLEAFRVLAPIIRATQDNKQEGGEKA